jgi:hypothetical protein
MRSPVLSPEGAVVVSGISTLLVCILNEPLTEWLSGARAFLSSFAVEIRD